MLRRPGGATLADMVAATGWRPRTVRGAPSDAIGNRLGLAVTSTREEERYRVYRVAG
ncbi:MAG: DUF3489 domain-containing protein [Rhodospirillales bacterium]|nr:MAG: DUF3489 domain-containing protein [Rhodospirillales bacterium]